ncbi:hypothetical protein GQ44DRAFT_616300 [Phaeosphaeriaceae sp. PMI808]|nr:hypothetical protein GQ44DRAFT_616300 [Phaeosphaeriaceae sp. PMI808]
MFPYPLQFQTKDPSWIYSGIAVNAAMYMGLHRAKQPPSLRSIAPIKGGIDLTTIEHMVRTHPLPAEFAYQIMVHHTLAKFFNTIVENSQENMAHSLIKIIDAELDSLKTRYPTPWTSRVEMNYLTAKLLLYTTVIIRLQSDRTTREILMRSGLSVAVRIAYLTDQGLAYQSTEFPDIPFESLMNTLPKIYYRVLVLSTAFLIRFFVLNSGATPEEQELARNHVAIAQRYLKLGCDDPRDERVRGAILFEVLCRQKPVDLESSKLKVDDRMGASLFYDAIATGHALRDMPVNVEEPLPEALKRPRSIVPSKEQEPEPSAYTVPEVTSMEMGFGPLDLPLPEDIWGDSIWGMFDPIAPTTYPTFTSEDINAQQYQYTWN